MSPGPDEPLALPGLPDGTWVTPTGDSLALNVFSLPTGLRLLTVSSTVLAALAMATGAWLLVGVLRTIGAGRPFDPRNPVRLVGVAAAVVLGGTVAPIVGNAGSAVAVDRLDLTGPDGPFALVLLELSLDPLLLALIVLAAAEAFGEAHCSPRAPRTRLMQAVPKRNDTDERPHRVHCHLVDLLESRGLTLTELAERVGLSVVNPSVLENDRARAVRFSTLTAICDILECQPRRCLLRRAPIAHAPLHRMLSNRPPDRELSNPGPIRYAFVTGWTVERLPSPLGSAG